MANLENLLQTLGRTQKLVAGYLTPVGTGGAAPNALDTVVALKNQFDYYTLLGSPLGNFTNRAEAPNILLSPAWIGSLGVGQDAIFLDDVQGRVDFSHTPKPAYIFSM
jgi:hypothetical protein